MTSKSSSAPSDLTQSALDLAVGHAVDELAGTRASKPPCDPSSADGRSVPSRTVVPAEVSTWIAAVNGARDADAEARLESRFGVSRTLVVYGTLAPGRPNHHVVAPLGGVWTDGVIVGELSEDGWGTTLGYPAYRPHPRGAAIAAHVLVSDALPGAWARLDAFEGPEYRRILVPVFEVGDSPARAFATVANVYAVAMPNR